MNIQQLYIFQLTQLTFEAGTGSCPCLDSIPYSLSFTYDSNDYDQDPSSQGIGCINHDRNLQPFCKDSGNNDLNPLPGFCSREWCWVDNNNCDLIDLTLTSMFNSSLQYSYRTCGNQQNFAKFITSASKSASELKLTIENQVSNIRTSYEQALEDSAIDCEVTRGCNFFETYSPQSQWTGTDATVQKVNFNYVNTQAPAVADLSDHTYRKFTCTSRSLVKEFMNMARSEQLESETDRVGWLQAGWEAQGTYIDWPVVESCQDNQDPRFRPWFANTVTGPKDVVIMIDTSGSMSGDSIPMAKAAATRIVGTLTDYDYATLIDYSSRTAQWDHLLQPMTAANKASLNAYIETLQAEGRTSFTNAFAKAFSIIENSFSHDPLMSSACLKVILFLTDGHSHLDVEAVTELNQQQGFKIFTQGLGQGADTSTIKDLACQNEGVAYHVTEASNLPNIMASYFKFFAHGIKNSEPRWTQQTDWITGASLLSACIALQDKNEFSAVNCMDLNLILDLSVLQAKSDYYSIFQPALQVDNQRCGNFNFNALGIDIESLRIQSGGMKCNTLDPWHQVLIWGGLLICLIILGLIGQQIYINQDSNQQKLDQN